MPTGFDDAFGAGGSLRRVYGRTTFCVLVADPTSGAEVVMGRGFQLSAANARARDMARGAGCVADRYLRPDGTLCVVLVSGPTIRTEAE